MSKKAIRTKSPSSPSSWRDKAHVMLPELRDEINTTDSPMSLWIEIVSWFESAYDAVPRNEDLIRRIYAFSDWCLEQEHSPEADASNDLLTCVATCFFEHIPTHAKAREDMPRWFNWDEIAGSREVFLYHIGADGFEELRKMYESNSLMSGKKHRSTKTPHASPRQKGRD